MKVSVWSILLILLSCYFIMGAWVTHNTYQSILAQHEAEKSEYRPIYPTPYSDTTILEIGLDLADSSVSFAYEQDYYHRSYIQGCIALVFVVLTMLSLRIDFKK